MALVWLTVERAYGEDLVYNFRADRNDNCPRALKVKVKG
jgi:hypothetical protein